MENRIGFGPRFGAFLIDIVLILVGGSIVGIAFGGMIGGAAGAAAGAGAEGGDEAAALASGFGAFFGAIVGIVIGVGIFAVLYSLIEGFTGASPGKMILKIKIGNADGSPANVGKYLTRYAIKNSSSICGVLALITGVGVLSTIGNLLGLVIFIGCFFVLGAAKQALHDMIAKTAVYPTAILAAGGASAGR